MSPIFILGPGHLAIISIGSKFRSCLARPLPPSTYMHIYLSAGFRTGLKKKFDSFKPEKYSKRLPLSLSISLPRSRVSKRFLIPRTPSIKFFCPRSAGARRGKETIPHPHTYTERNGQSFPLTRESRPACMYAKARGRERQAFGARTPARVLE